MLRSLWVLALAVVIAAPAIAEDWTTYENARFGTALDLPVGLTAAPPPTNGDGRSFSSADGNTQIVVYAGFWDVRSNNWGEYRAWIGETIANGGGKVTYEAGGDDWFVFSGTLRGSIFYTRANRSSRCPSIAHHVEIAYPVAEKDRRDPWVTRITKSMGEVASAECP